MIIIVGIHIWMQSAGLCVPVHRVLGIERCGAVRVSKCCFIQLVCVRRYTITRSHAPNYTDYYYILSFDCSNLRLNQEQWACCAVMSNKYTCNIQNFLRKRKQHQRRRHHRALKPCVLNAKYTQHTQHAHTLIEIRCYNCLNLENMRCWEICAANNQHI